PTGPTRSTPSAPATWRRRPGSWEPASVTSPPTTCSTGPPAGPTPNGTSPTRDPSTAGPSSGARPSCPVPTRSSARRGCAGATAGPDPDLSPPITTSELDPPRPAPRPPYSVLDNAALRLSGIHLLDDHHEPLARLVKYLA